MPGQQIFPGMYWVGTDLFIYNAKMATKVVFYALMPCNSKTVSRRSNIHSDTMEGIGRKAVALSLVKKI